jgi:hypothetical protein
VGKSPLRLIVRRRWHNMVVMTDTLECEHEVYRARDFLWDEGHLVHPNPTEKRRRCEECAKQIASERPRGSALALPPKKPAASVTRTRRTA